MTTGFEKCLQQSSARLRPVTMPSFAESAWKSMATTLAKSTTQDVRGEIAGIHIGDGGDDGRPEERQQRARPAPLSAEDGLGRAPRSRARTPGRNPVRDLRHLRPPSGPS